MPRAGLSVLAYPGRPRFERVVDMKRTIVSAALVVALAACDSRTAGDKNSEMGTATAADEEGAPDYSAVARRVVRESAAVKPGEVVVINGDASELKLLEALVEEVQLAGGSPLVSLNFPRANKRALMESSPEFLRLPPKAGLAVIEAGDVFISASAVEDPNLYSDVDETRLSVVRQANQAITRAISQKRGRSVDIGQTGGIPTAAYAKNQNADHAEMRNMFFKALAVPSTVIAQRGSAVSQKMQSGQMVRLRSAGGTDVTFRLAASKPRVSTGRAADNDTGQGMANAFLPAGDFYACVDPSSANGTVVAPEGTFRGKSTKNVRLTFKAGSLVSVTADDGGEALTRFFSQLDADSKKMSLINIGLNPESRPLKGSKYLSWEMDGVPTVVVGNSLWAGCQQGGQDSYSVHQAGATLAAGNAEVVRNGTLVLE